MANTRFPTRHLLTRTILGACFALLTACAGESPTQSNGPGSTPKPSPAPLAKGIVALTVTGLDAGQPADIVITGPAGFSRTVTTSGAVGGLAAGRYTISARTVPASDRNYVPAPATQDVDVPTDGPPVSATVAYRLEAGVVIVTVGGLPGGVPGDITLTPPSGATISVAETRQLDDVLPGRWRLAASPVASVGHTYNPVPASYDVPLAANDTLRMPVNYALGTGGIAVAVTGLPTGTNGAVSVTGPGGYNQAVTGTITLTNLVPGEYTVAAMPVTVGTIIFAPVPAQRAVTVSASLVAEPAVVNYQQQVGRLEISAPGLPASITPTFTLTGSSGTRELSGTGAVDSLLPGAYTLHAATLQIGATTYTPAPPSQSVIITSAATTSVSFAYTATLTTGSLAVTLTGLPAGVNGSVSIAGPGGFTQNVTASTTLANLAPGNYTLNANSVSSGGTSYTPSPASTTVTVAAGATASASFTYVPGGGGGGTNLSIANVYVMQAAQNWNGTAQIVTGRAALVRVFVKASAANTLQPSVRVQVYDGGTLLQTATIPAPTGSVPVTVSEGVLNSSWNLQIPAANVRAGLRVLADVDPTNAIGETNRADNVWPSDGTPAIIATVTVPALVVKFVPVVLNGMTGNVNNGNKDQFLAMTRAAMPVQSVTSSVRAAFTSNAPPLQSTNANNAWSTVLSEINALRMADGAAGNVHYYGVVKAGYSSGVAGIAYVPGRAAVGWDAMPTGDRIAAHELGHNFNRPHTPCGVSGDAAYPYSGGVTGVYGWNSSTNALVSPAWTDVMGYCNNQWISDWTWSRVIEYRAAAGYEAATVAAGDGLLVWGRVVDGRVLLEPAFRVHARPSPRAARATHRVVLSDANGASLAEVPIEAQLVDHVLDHEERQFAVVVPWSDQMERLTARIAVTDPRTPFPSAVRTSAMGAADPSSSVVLPDPGESVQEVGAGRARVTWNATRYPMALVRDAATGEILAFLRQPGDGYTASNRAVDLVFSDGVRSTVKIRR